MLGEFVNLVMNFLLNVIKLTKENLNLTWISNNPQTPSPPSPTIDLETGYYEQSATNVEVQSNNGSPHYHPPSNDQWQFIGVCVAVIGITVQYLQTSGLLNSMSFHWICISMVFSLTAVMVSIYIPGVYKLVSHLTVHVGLLIAFTALVVALVINIPLPFKAIAVAVYSIGILIIIFANLRKLKP